MCWEWWHYNIFRNFDCIESARGRSFTRAGWSSRESMALMLGYLCAVRCKGWVLWMCVGGTEEGSTIHGCRCGGRTVKEQFDTLIQFVSAIRGVRLLSRRTKNGTRKRMCHEMMNIWSYIVAQIVCRMFRVFWFLLFIYFHRFLFKIVAILST